MGTGTGQLLDVWLATERRTTHAAGAGSAPFGVGQGGLDGRIVPSKGTMSSAQRAWMVNCDPPEKKLSVPVNALRYVPSMRIGSKPADMLPLAWIATFASCPSLFFPERTSWNCCSLM